MESASLATELLTVLRRHWGYSSFLPLQERIVASLMAGRDTCVIMPTGGGKSLCYQIPALCRPGTAIIISPLIALMDDQVAALRQVGVHAGGRLKGVTSTRWPATVGVAELQARMAIESAATAMARTRGVMRGEPQSASGPDPSRPR